LFDVEIQPGAFSELPWESATGGGIQFSIIDSPRGTDVFRQHSIGLAEWEPLTLVGMAGQSEPKAGASSVLTNQFQTSLGDGVIAVSRLGVSFPRIEIGSSRDGQYKSFQPGQPRYAPVQLTLAEDSQALETAHDWVKQTYQGNEDRRDLTIDVRNQVDDNVLMFVLLDCIPSELTPVSAGTEGSTRYMKLVTECGRIEISSARTDIDDWLNTMINQSDPAASYREVALSLLDRDGTILNTIDYQECFLTSYSVTPLNAGQQNEPVRETITINVGYSDNFLN
jgi:hypothetical protein